MRVVAEASLGREGIAAFGMHRPDVTLVDLRLPDISGVEVMRAIRKELPSARFIVLTTYSGDVQALDALASVISYRARAVRGGTANNTNSQQLVLSRSKGN